MKSFDETFSAMQKYHFSFSVFRVQQVNVFNQFRILPLYQLFCIFPIILPYSKLAISFG